MSRMDYLNPDTKPINVPTTNDIYWAAGIFEGEGTVGGIPRNNVMITQKDLWVLERVRDFFGGKIYLPKGRDCSAWYLGGARARGFIQTIYILLSPRRQEQVRPLFFTPK